MGAIPLCSIKCKGKSVPLQAWSGPEGSRKLRFPDFMTTAQDGGKVVSLTHRPLLPLEIHLVLISVRGWVDPRATVRPGGLWYRMYYHYLKHQVITYLAGHPYSQYASVHQFPVCLMRTEIQNRLHWIFMWQITECSQFGEVCCVSVLFMCDVVNYSETHDKQLIKCILFVYHG